MEIPPKIKRSIAGYPIKAKTLFLELFVPSKNNNFLPKALKSKYLFWYGATLLTVKIALISLVLILPSTDFFSAIAVDRLATLINQERQNRNLPTLTMNTQLNSAASLKINDMLAQNYFEHTSPFGITPWYWFNQIGYNFAYAGENLAIGFTQTDTVFQAWMNSPTHRDNILNPNFKEMGLSVRSGSIQGREDTLAVLVFGQQLEQTAKPQIAQAPIKNNSSAPAPKNPAPKKTPIVSSTQLTLAPSPAGSGPTASQPSASPSITPSQTPIVLAEQIKLETALNAQRPTDKIGYAPRVLGAFVSKSDEIFKSLYLYFTLFIAIALAVNIFVKIEIQHWTTIMATTLIIILSSVLIFI